MRESVVILVTTDSYNSAKKISQGLDQGELQEIVIRGTKGYTIILVGAQDNNYMLFSSCKKAFKLGYYIHKLKKAFEIMAPVLEQIPQE